MRLKVKVLYEEKYKSGEHFDMAIDRWCEKGWCLADLVFLMKDDTNAAILYRVVESAGK